MAYRRHHRARRRADILSVANVRHQRLSPDLHNQYELFRTDDFGRTWHLTTRFPTG